MEATNRSIYSTEREKERRKHSNEYDECNKHEGGKWQKWKTGVNVKEIVILN